MTNRSSKRRGLSPIGGEDVLRLTFHGAVEGVTGSCFLLETPGGNLVVECGMFQGGRSAATRNRRPFPFDPAGIDQVLLTHAHIDHSGLLPKLVRDGFRGQIHCTRPTSGLLEIMLPDSAHIHEQDARHASRRLLRRGKKPLEPLYTTEDAQAALRRVTAHPFAQWAQVCPGVRVRFRRAGHILGSASIEIGVTLETVERRLVVSGDVGRSAEPILQDPDPPSEADLVVLESTYGDRDHRDREGSLGEFSAILRAARAAKQNVIVPVFAVGRAQEVLHYLGEFERGGHNGPMPVYLDSPMAISVTELYGRHTDCFEGELREAIAAGGRPLEPRQFSLCRTPEESMALNQKRGIVILAGSGMCDAGRVVHHLKHNLWREGTHVVIVGFQAQGTVGRALVDGARKVRILGEEIAVRAQVHTLGGFSAHAGQSELVDWAAELQRSGASFALAHGEPDRRGALRKCLQRVANTRVFEPELGDAIALRRRGEVLAFEPAKSSRSRRGAHAPSARGKRDRSSRSS